LDYKVFGRGKYYCETIIPGMAVEQALSYILKFVDVCDIVPIPYIGPVRLLYSFVLPRWWSTCWGLCAVRLFYPGKEALREITVYVLNLDDMSKKQVNSVWPSVTYDVKPESMWFDPSCYDSTRGIRNTRSYFLWYKPGTLSREFVGIYPVRESGLFMIDGEYRRAKTCTGYAMYRSRCGRWFGVHSTTVFDYDDKLIADFTYYSLPFESGWNPIIIGSLPVGTARTLWMFESDEKFAWMHDPHATMPVAELDHA